VASAWCAYQSTLWGGVQTFKLAAANNAQETRLFDGLMLIHYVEQRLSGSCSAMPSG